MQQKARDFALKDVLPVAWYYNEKDEIPLKVLRKAFDAGLIGFATSEPSMGSDVTGIRCRAEVVGDDYLLNGTKY